MLAPLGLSNVSSCTEERAVLIPLLAGTVDSIFATVLAVDSTAFTPRPNSWVWFGRSGFLNLSGSFSSIITTSEILILWIISVRLSILETTTSNRGLMMLSPLSQEMRSFSLEPSLSRMILGEMQLILLRSVSIWSQSRRFYLTDLQLQVRFAN